MKRIKTLALACLMAVSASAQSEPGTFSLYPRLGLNISKFTQNAIFVGDPAFSGTNYMKNRYKQGINAGAEFQYQITDNFAVSAGAMYSMEGTNFSDVIYFSNDNKHQYEYNDQDMQLHYINVPIMAVGYLGESGFAIKAGVQIGVLLNASQSYKIVGYDKVGNEWQVNEELSGSYSESSPDAFHKLNVSIPVGVSYEFSNVALDLRYNIGLSKLYKSIMYKDYPGIDKVKNSTIEFIVGYKFEL